MDDAEGPRRGRGNPSSRPEPQAAFNPDPSNDVPDPMALARREPSGIPAREPSGGLSVLLEGQSARSPEGKKRLPQLREGAPEAFLLLIAMQSRRARPSHRPQAPETSAPPGRPSIGPPLTAPQWDRVRASTGAAEPTPATMPIQPAETGSHAILDHARRVQRAHSRRDDTRCRDRPDDDHRRRTASPRRRRGMVRQPPELIRG